MREQWLFCLYEWAHTNSQWFISLDPDSSDTHVHNIQANGFRKDNEYCYSLTFTDDLS